MITLIDRAPRIRKIVVYDLEWIPGTLEVRLVGVYDGHRYRCYRTVREFIVAELTSRNRGVWFYAHAGGLADVQFVLHELELMRRQGSEWFRFDAKFSGSSAIIVNVGHGKNSWHFCDSYWLLRDKLRNIGKSIGVEKGLAVEQPTDDPDEDDISDDEYERRIIARKNWYATCPWNVLRDYNYRDCLILWLAINAFEDAVLEMGGQLQMTIASTAMQLFRRRYLQREINTNSEVNECSRGSYFASRVEVIQRDVEDSWYYDINSSFPYAMTFPCPGEYLGSSRSIPTEGLYIADVDIQQPESFLPPIPKRLGGRVFFPHGAWRTWLTSVDVDLLYREGGRITRIHEVLRFEPFEDLAGYAQDIFKRRQATKDEFVRLVLKFLLNSLYGKFAEANEKQSLVYDPMRVPITREEQASMGMTMLFPGAWLQTRKVPIAHQHVPIATHITSIGRRTLYNHMIACDEVHYCDTDGFSTTTQFSQSKKLGGLKLERRTYRGTFAASKLYDIDGAVMEDGTWKAKRYTRMKGFQRPTATRFARLLEGQEIEMERMARIRERWRAGDTSPQESVIKKRMRLKMSWEPSFNAATDSLPKRFMYPDGHTRPWHLSELESVYGKAS